MKKQIQEGECADCGYWFPKLYSCRASKNALWKTVCGDCCDKTHLKITKDQNHDR
jgi:hypothetical protein